MADKADGVQEYKDFIDGLMEWPRVSVQTRWVNDWDRDEVEKTYRVPEDHPLQRLMPNLSAEQRETLAELLLRERESSIHDVLAYLASYSLTRDDVPLASEPFGTEMYYDFSARKGGSEWPEKSLAE